MNNFVVVKKKIYKTSIALAVSGWMAVAVLGYIAIDISHDNKKNMDDLKMSIQQFNKLSSKSIDLQLRVYELEENQ